ncbi:hypothetical protein IAE22_30590, partial [Bacillus sp. S34]|nr:hypothetical protein [Bacillus sp. S34]
MGALEPPELDAVLEHAEQVRAARKAGYVVKILATAERLTDADVGSFGLIAAIIVLERDGGLTASDQRAARSASPSRKDMPLTP